MDFASRQHQRGAALRKGSCGGSGRRSSAFFNTSGLVYRSLGLKDKALHPDRKSSWPCWLPTACWSRPLLVGFRPAEWEAAVK